jgi:hypothetical protein
MNRASPAEKLAAAMEPVRSWANLQSLIGQTLPAHTLVGNIAALDRNETLFTLARIAGDLANSAGGPFGREARSWTHDLLVRRQHSPHPFEQAVSRAVVQLSANTPIAHAHVIFALQLHAIVHGANNDGVRPDDGYLAFLMLWMNDYLPEWPRPYRMSKTEDVVATMFFSSIFNRSDDPLRFTVRLVDIMAQAPTRLAGVSWADIEHEAFGTSFKEYATAFLVPMFMSSKIWGGKNVPVIERTTYEKLSTDNALFSRWLSQASLPIDRAATTFAARRLPSGLLAVPPSFFRTPLIEVGPGFIGLSPWHMRDHTLYGTWSKLNEACKKLLGSKGNQAFSAEWGKMFERWCRSLAAGTQPHATEQLILSTNVGDDDEIEDVVFVRGNTVALLSAKASLVPETAVKFAESPGDAIVWLRRFLFEEPSSAKRRGHRGGALHLLEKKRAAIRAGAFERRGIARDATIVPCIVSFDHIGESGALYDWIGEECRRCKVLVDDNVNPLTIITPEDYEGLLALRSKGLSVCELLLEKTSGANYLKPLDRLLFSKIDKDTDLRPPSAATRFSAIVDETMTRMQRVTTEGNRELKPHTESSE